MTSSQSHHASHARPHMSALSRVRTGVLAMSAIALTLSVGGSTLPSEAPSPVHSMSASVPPASIMTAASRSAPRTSVDDDVSWGGIEKLDVGYHQSKDEKQAVSDLKSSIDDAKKSLLSSTAITTAIKDSQTLLDGVDDSTAIDVAKFSQQKKTVDDAVADAQQKATARQVESSKSSKSSAPTLAPSTPRGEMQQWAHDYLISNGYTETDWSAANYIISHESGWNPNARNPSSGAGGLPQSLPMSKMSSAGADWATNYQTQFKWFVGYCSRYGSIQGAYQFWLSHHWY